MTAYQFVVPPGDRGEEIELRRAFYQKLLYIYNQHASYFSTFAREKILIEVSFQQTDGSSCFSRARPKADQRRRRHSAGVCGGGGSDSSKKPSFLRSVSEKTLVVKKLHQDARFNFLCHGGGVVQEEEEGGDNHHKFLQHDRTPETRRIIRQ